MRKLILSTIITLIVIGCASRTSVFNSSSYENFDYTVVAMPSFKITSDILDCSDPAEPDENLKEIFAEFDIPLTMTPRVNYYLKYFTGSGKPVMQKWMDRSNKYMYIVREIFQQEGVPLDLVVLGYTESGYNPMAYSRAGAAGIWQFMPSTGKIYGLNANDWVDERRDFEKATRAAARHLNDLNRSFGDWYLALAAYNAGAGKITRATKAHKSNDFFTIATGTTLKLETKDYVPKYLAQLIIYKNPSDYGFSPTSEVPLLYKTVELDRQANLYVIASMLDCTYSELKELNPELLTPMTPPAPGYNLRVPLDKHHEALAILTDKNTDITRYRVYVANSGEKISSIAKKYGVTASSIKTINNFPYDSVYSRKLFFIPNPNVELSVIDTYFSKDIAKLTPKYYTVRKGDNMTMISKKHNMPLATLVKLNPKVNPRKIYPGQVLVISLGGHG